MKKPFFLLILLLAAPLLIFSQVFQGNAAEKLIKGSNLLRYTKNITNPAYIKYNAGQQPDFAGFESWFSKTFSMKPEMGFILVNSETDRLGYTHYRYRQTYKGIPIHEADFIIHVLNGKICSFNGTVFSSLDLPEASAITPDNALELTLAYINATKYKWQDENAEAWLKKITGNPDASYVPTAVREIIFSDFYKSYRIAYKFDIYASKPLSRQDVYVDVVTGKIIKKLNKLFTTDANGTAVTKYSGTQAITTDSVASTSFHLRESGRGNGIGTFNLQQGTDYSTSVDFSDEDNYWNNVNSQMDEAAGDAHWGAEKTYDYYMNVHGRNSIDGNGFALYSYVHYDQSYGNAFWDGTCMTYGDGDNNNPFTTLDICGHEITHGLDSYTANLDYADESGAMNEGFSDIFGTAIEFYGKPSMANWTCGEDIGFVIRNLQNPNAEQNPDTYMGDYWDPGQEVHANSTVLSHWYYLVCQGGSGTNDIGNTFSVTGIGMTKASDVAFRMLTVYLINTSDYQDACFYAGVAASDLFGSCTPEVESVTNAMYAVGLGNPYTPEVTVGFTAENTEVCSIPLTVSFSNQTTNASNYLWKFGDGTTSTDANPVHIYTALGNYDVKLIASSTGCGTDSLTQTGFVSIAPTNSNYATMPATGTGAALTCCTGTLFDSGGEGNYSNDTHGTITISPTGASSVVLNFSSFNLETGYDYLYIYDGSTLASPLIGQFDGTNLPNGGTIQSTHGSITLRQVTDEGLVMAGFELTWHCNMPSTPPVTNFSADELSNCTGVIHFTDMSVNGPTSWHWDFGDGDTSNLQNPVHTYMTNGTYTVTLTTSNDFGSDTQIYSDYVTIINLPATPVTTPGSGCDSSSVTLSATGSGQLDWYDTATDGTLLYTGNTFITPTLYTTTTYYVEVRSLTPSLYVGKTDNSGSGGYFGSASNIHYEIFNCLAPVTLVSVKVYAGSDGNRTILLRDSSQTILQSADVFIPSGESRITLNFNLPVQNNLQLLGDGAPDLFRNNNGAASYPYNLANYITITESSASLPPYNVLGNYYYFYDWEVQERPCISPRIPVVATIYDCNGIAESESQNLFTIYPNPATNNFTIEFSGMENEEVILSLIDLIGKEVLYKDFTASQGLNHHFINCSDLSQGVYLVQLKSSSKNIIRKIIIQ